MRDLCCALVVRSCLNSLRCAAGARLAGVLIHCSCYHASVTLHRSRHSQPLLSQQPTSQQQILHPQILHRYCCIHRYCSGSRFEATRERLRVSISASRELSCNSRKLGSRCMVASPWCHAWCTARSTVLAAQLAQHRQRPQDALTDVTSKCCSHWRHDPFHFITKKLTIFGNVIFRSHAERIDSVPRCAILAAYVGLERKPKSKTYAM